MNVADLSFSPRKIAVGGASQLIVTLDRPASAGGVTVTINGNYNGSASTFINILQSIPVTQGNTTAYYTLQTQLVSNPTTQATFFAYIGSGPAKSAILDIN